MLREACADLGDMTQDPPRNSRFASIALTAVALCTVAVPTAQGATADRGASDRPMARRIYAAAMPNHAEQLSGCYDEARAGDPELELRMMVSFVVAGDGSVASVAIPEATTYNAVLESCVKDVVEGFQFPGGAGGTTVNAPLVFRNDRRVD